jgi:hypothetical protein
MSFEKELNTIAILYSTGFGHKVALQVAAKSRNSILLPQKDRSLESCA